MTSFPARILVSVLLLLGLAACKSVQPEPFSEFDTALVKLRKGADSALAVNAKWASERFVASVVEAQQRIDAAAAKGVEPEPPDVQLIQGLLLETVAHNGLAPILPEDHLYLGAQRFRQGVYQLNSVFLHYAELLVQLASPSLAPKAQLRKLAKELNANAAAALKALGVTKLRDPARGVFSIAVGEASHLGFEAARRSQLQATLVKSQRTVQAYADKGREAIAIAARHSQQEYEQRSSQMLDAFVAASPSRRPKLAKGIVDLDTRYIKQLEALRSLDAAYARLPTAHSQLLKAAGGSSAGAGSLVALLEDANRLAGLARKLE